MQILEGIQVQAFLKAAPCTMFLFAMCQCFSEVCLFVALYPDNELSGSMSETESFALGSHPISGLGFLSLSAGDLDWLLCLFYSALCLSSWLQQ